MVAADDPVSACPDCDKCEIAKRSSQQPTYLCLRCGSEFDEPVERDPVPDRPYLPTVLDDLDADEVPP